MLNQIKYLLAYLPVFLLDCLFRILPKKVAIKIGEGAGFLLSFALWSRRKLVYKNLAHAFPKKTEAERRKIARAMWRNLGRVSVEFIRVSEITSKNYNTFFVEEGRSNYEKAMKENKGLILVGFHFTNWEYSGIGFQFFNRNVVAIARPIKNPWVEKWIQRKRSLSGMNIILHRQAVKESLRVLKKREVIGILTDQNLYTGGIFVDFFGRPAATTTLPALLHFRTGAPVILFYSMRENGKIKLVYGPPLKFPDRDNKDEWVKAATQIYTHQLEKVIREKPENWFWLHNRWKRTPV